MSRMDPILIFDGECGFCTWMARFVSRRAVLDIHTAPWQRADLTSFGLSEEEARSVVWWIDEKGRRHPAQRAVGRALATTSGVWRVLGHLILVPPFVWLAGPVYHLVAAIRGHLPGIRPACQTGYSSRN